MKKFPLSRVKLSNEHIMSIMFGILILFQVPYWIENIWSMFSFLGVLGIGLLLDIILSMKMGEDIKCCVSTAVTVGIIYALFPNIPFWGSLLGVTIALLLGKKIWGGMGKNILNPAMVGVVVLNLIFQTGSTLFDFNIIVVIAMLLSIPFIFIRPYASIGFMSGMIFSLSFNGILSLESVISTGILFLGCIVLTDPVTITRKPLTGALGGFGLGFISLLFPDYFSVGAMALSVMILNLISYVFDNQLSLNYKIKTKGTKLKKPYIKINEPKSNAEIYRGNLSDADINESLTVKYILKKIEDNKVVGLGGAGFPTHLKIKAAIDAKVEKKFLIVNAVECDPGLIHDKWLLKHHSKEIEKGIRLVIKCLEACKVLVATKGNVKVEFKDEIEMVEVPDIYPIGDEKKLIKNMVGIELPFNAIPSKEGVLVLNIQTIFSIYEAVYLNKKADTKFITVANLLKKEANILSVKLGSKVSDVIESTNDGDGLVFVGGGLMQGRRADEDEVVEKMTNFIAIAEMPRYKEGNCSKCGICVRRCPSNLEVHKIASIVEKGKLEETRIYNPERCIECGVCSYFCLAGKNLSMKVKSAKEFISSSQ